MATRDQKLYTKLFVTNIPGDITKEFFIQLIQPYAKNGKIIEIKFFKRVVSESCYAFIHFESYLDGEKCMEDLNRRILNGHTMRVGPASKRNPLLSQTNLYIEGVPKEWTDSDLRKHFGEFGEISAARILVDKGSNASREVGFVHFTVHENALSAMETWQDNKAYKTAERPFKIKFANKGRKKDDDDMLHHTMGKSDMLHLKGGTIGPSQYPQSEMNTPRFDEPCRYFQRGNCKRGKNCFYRHGNVSVTPHTYHTQAPTMPPPPPVHPHAHPQLPHTDPYGYASANPYATNAILMNNYYLPTTASAASAAAAYYQQYAHYAQQQQQQTYPQQPQMTAATQYYQPTQYYHPSQYYQPTPMQQQQMTAATATAIAMAPPISTKTEKDTSNAAEEEKDNSNKIVSGGYGASRQQTSAATAARWDPYKAQTAMYPGYAYPPPPTAVTTAAAVSAVPTAVTTAAPTVPTVQSSAPSAPPQ